MKKIISLGLVMFFTLLAISNISAQAVVTLTPGGSHNATLQGTTEQRYSITVPAGRLTVFTESNLDTIMRIYNAQGTEIAWDDDSGEGFNARISISVAAGTYTISIRGYSSRDTGPYTLRTSTQSVAVTNLTLGTPHSATLRGVTEQIYSITLPAGNFTAYTESNLDTVMRIFNAQGEQVGYNDDSGGHDYNARIDISVPAGTYTIEVRGYDDRENGPYILHTSINQVIEDRISYGTPHNAVLQGTLRQRFTVSVPDGVLVAYTESNLDTVMRIYNIHGDEIAYDDDSGGGRNARISVLVSAGTYTIEIHGYNDREVGPYTLHIADESEIATTITVGRPHNAELQGETVQIYRVTVSAGTLIAYTESSLDTIIRIFNSRDEQIAWDDDSGDRYNARATAYVTAGTYTIHVSGWNRDAVGPYTLHTINR